MMTLAVTGGIGSGKSYVVRMFSALGIPVYDADSRKAINQWIEDMVSYSKRISEKGE